MRKIIFYILFIFCSAYSLHAQQQSSGCCPEFSLEQLDKISPCPGDTSCKSGTAPNGGNPAGGPALITACKNSVQKYYVYPVMPGFTYNWQIAGGTPVTTAGNPATITWGSGSQGFIQVIISDASGSCKDTITKKVCLLDAPVAAFTTAPNTTVCANSTPLLFNAAAAVGAVTYNWNFGDGGTASGVTASHLYTTPGTYTVTLTVSNAGGGSANGDLSRCGCTDTATAVITVQAGNGPVITSSCKKMLCPGDTATYCVSPACPPYSWSVNGGTIIANNGSCITVQWNSPPVNYPTSVTVTTGCNNTCGNTATLNVPVLYNNIPVNGEDTVCVGATTTYTLPTLPGTFYNWTVTGGGGGVIVGPNQNTPSITVNWAGPQGNATITCNYYNPYSGCSGTTTLSVKVKKKFVISGPASVCAASSALYAVSGPGNANWSISPNTGFSISGSSTNVPNINVTWNTPGTYTVTAVPAAAGTFCNSSASIVVVVKPKPVLSAISGPASVCPNSYYIYSVSSNLSGPFTWTATNGTVISQMGANNDSVVVQWNTSATHSLQVTQTVNGCSTSANITVTNIPAPSISGPNAVCHDQNPQPVYTASGSLPPGSYTWSISPAAAGTITGGQGSNAITVQWHGTSTPGSNTANVSVTVCGNTASYPVTVTTPPNGTITKTGSLCASGVVLTVSGITCSSYKWYKNGVLVATTSINTYTATSHGYYEVKCASGCIGYAGIYVPREFIPNVTITADNYLTYCTGSPVNVNLISASHPGCSLLWYKNGVSTGVTSGTLNVTTTGSYYVVVSCGNCKDTSNTLTVSTIPCDPGPGCNFSFVPKNNNIGNAGPARETDPSEKALYTATLNIGTPTNLCNNPQFSATYSFTSPHSLNSGIHWDFGDNTTYSTTTSGGFTPAHAYSQIGTYIVTAWVDVNCPPPPTPHICRLIDTIHYTVPIASNFNYSVNCDKVYLTSLASVVNTCSITSYAWSATGPGTAAFSNPSNPTPVLTVSQSGIYNVTLTVTSSCNGCTASITLPVSITLPTASFTIPNVVCAGSPVAFNAPGGMSNYLWEFGDLPVTYTSSLQNTVHAYAATPTPPYTTTATLTVMDAMGCIAKDTELVQVIAPPPLTITPDTLICPGSTVTLTAGNGFVNYAWYHNGNLVQNGTSNTYTTGVMGTYYVVGTSSNGGCLVQSVSTHVFYKQKPIADIQGSTVACLSAGTAYIYLYNSDNNPNNTYNWTLQGNNTSLSNTFDLNTTQNTAGNYSYVLTVTGANGCVSRDTFCVIVGNSPTVTLTGASGTLCAGTSYTFVASATPPNPNYIYQWSNGIVNDTMTTSLPGMYMVMVTDPSNGCMGSAFAANILPRPSTLLFPVGCDTLCDTAKIIPPLPLAIGQNYSMYTIQWLNNGVPISPQPTPQHILNLASLGTGQHNISVVVTLNGCSDTSGVYNLYVKNCNCDCKESHWGDIVLTQGDKAAAKAANPKANVPVDNGQKLECKGSYMLKCNQPYTINASYFCKDTACPPKVTYSLQPPSGSPVTGNAPVTFTPTQNGTYTLMLYGWCDGKICDSCRIEFKVECEKPCDCKGSKWGEKTITVSNTTKPLKCMKQEEKPLTVKCKDPVSINANYICADPACPGTVSYTLNTPSGTTTGTLPLTFIPNQTGLYTVTLYGMCGNTVCDTCVVRFKAECPVDTLCCPYNIKADTSKLTYSYNQAYNATIASQNFIINGLAGVPLTEVRAEVLSYTITDNYNKECMKCVNLPYTWASVLSAGTISTVPPKITMYNSAVHPFNPTGAGVYQNPREVVWNNGSTFTIANNTGIGMNFIFPPPPLIDCCELKGRICVKFTFRDKDCKECEVISCFEFVVKNKKGF